MGQLGESKFQRLDLGLLILDLRLPGLTQLDQLLTAKTV